MTEWGIDTLFNPGKRHMDEEKRRLQSTREEIGDSSGGRRIDLESGTVTISRRPPNPPATQDESAEDESAENESAEDESAEDESAEDKSAEDRAVGEADAAAETGTTDLTADEAAAEADRSASGE